MFWYSVSCMMLIVDTPVLDLLQANNRLVIVHKFLLKIQDGMDDLKVVLHPVVDFLQ